MGPKIKRTRTRHKLRSKVAATCCVVVVVAVVVGGTCAHEWVFTRACLRV